MGDKITKLEYAEGLKKHLIDNGLGDETEVTVEVLTAIMEYSVKLANDRIEKIKENRSIKFNLK